MGSFNPVPSLYTPQGQRKYLNENERKRFLAAARRCKRVEVRALCLTIAFTGCRITEALRLCRNALDPAGGILAFRSLKKRNGIIVFREIPIPDELVRALLKLDRIGDQRFWHFCRTRAWQFIKAVMAEADVESGPHATPKGLRHGFGIHALLYSNVPINFVQRWLGHQRMETTAIYLQAIGPDERSVAARMWRKTSSH